MFEMRADLWLGTRAAILSASTYLASWRGADRTGAGSVAHHCPPGQSAVGDVRDVQTGVRLGRVSNQQIGQWPHVQFVRYLTEKARRVGITVEQRDESSSSRTCRVSGHVHPSSPRGGRFRCAGCAARVHRDVNGSASSCSRAASGCYGLVQADAIT